jgi:glycosyltransferase involved in cell wall biosynthesis
MSSPRILYLSSCWPHDKSYGGQLRAFHIGRALQQLGRPTLVVIGAHDVDPAVKAKAAEEFDIGREIKLLESPVRRLARTTSILNRDFTNIHGFVAEPSDEAWLVDAQKRFDVSWFFKLRTANYLSRARWNRSVVDVDDLPSTMEKSRARHGPTLRVRTKAWLRMLELRCYERRLGRRFDVVSVCSEADRAALNGTMPTYVIPNGFTRPSGAPPRKVSQPPRIGFMGLYSYEPNMDGVRWFAKHCWPRIQAEIPGVRLRLVGEDTNGPMKPSDPAIDGLGWVENPAEEVASWSLMIVPIRIGAGTRVKIADAFSRKCPLVSTSFGALGYDVQHGRDLLLADAPDDFAASCISLIRDRERAEQMAERAHQLFLEKWTWDAVTPRVWSAVEDCLRRNFGN